MVNLVVEAVIHAVSEELQGRSYEAAGDHQVPSCAVPSGIAPEEAVFDLVSQSTGRFPDSIRFSKWRRWKAADATETLLLTYECRVEESLPSSSCAESRRSSTVVSTPPHTSQHSTASHRSLRAGTPSRRAKADVVLVQPFFPLGDKEALSIPLGFAYMVSAAEARGYSALVYDCNIDDDYAAYCNVEAIDAAVVGVQFHSAHSWDFCMRAVRRLRTLAPGAMLLAGGELASTRARTLLEDGLVDAIATQEGELALVELLHQLESGRSDLRSVPGLMSLSRPVPLPAQVRDLDALPDPSIDAFRWRRYGQWSLMTSRGCPYRCSYCSSAAFWNHTIRYHSVPWLVRQFDRLADRGGESVFIADDTFTMNARRVRDFCDTMRTRRSLDWSCLTRVDRVDRGLLERMAEAGCRQVSFGYETSNDAALSLATKRTTAAQAKRAVGLCSEVGIRSRVSVIIGLPGETRASVQGTIEDLCEIRPNEVQVYALTPHDGTVLFDNAESLGIRMLEDDASLWTRDIRRPVCETTTLTADDIRDLGLTMMARLVDLGYADLTQLQGPKKIGAEYTVGTAFTPVQSIGGVGGKDEI